MIKGQRLEKALRGKSLQGKIIVVPTIKYSRKQQQMNGLVKGNKWMLSKSHNLYNLLLLTYSYVTNFTNFSHRKCKDYLPLINFIRGFKLPALNFKILKRDFE